MKELIEALEYATNVRMLRWEDELNVWTIYYHNDLRPDTVTSEDLIDFLYNA